MGFLSWLIGPVQRFSIPVRDLAPQLRPKVSKTNNINSMADKNKITRGVVNAMSLYQTSTMSTNTSPNTWLSGVKIEKCRYLVESGCKSACIHLCKTPTQEFFNKELGMPLYMKPNFNDQS